MSKPTAVVHFDSRGEPAYYTMDGCRLLVIDERAPTDRVYEITTFLSQEDLSSLLDGDVIGSQYDDRHPALSARITEALGGPRRLRPIED